MRVNLEGFESFLMGRLKAVRVNLKERNERE